MKEFLNDSNLEPFSFTHMKTELKRHFSDRIIITEINGKQNVVLPYHCFKNITKFS